MSSTLTMKGLAHDLKPTNIWIGVVNLIKLRFISPCGVIINKIYIMSLFKKLIASATILFSSLCYATAIPSVSSEVLATPLKTIDEGAQQGLPLNFTIHQNFPRIIEQNFALLKGVTAKIAVDGFSDQELEQLAQLYVNANSDLGREGKLPAVLSENLDGTRLGRMAKFFGHDTIRMAIIKYAPTKLATFEKNSQIWYAAPTPGPLKNNIFPVDFSGSATESGLGKWMGYTPYEIYLDFRTAPIGALSVTGALFETSVALAKGVGIAYGVGYTAGTAAASLIETYSPSLWDAIGGTVANAVTNIQTAATSVLSGKYEKSAGSLFGLTSSQTNSMVSYGGDYSVAIDWYDYEMKSCKNVPGDYAAYTDCNGKGK